MISILLALGGVAAGMLFHAWLRWAWPDISVVWRPWTPVERAHWEAWIEKVRADDEERARRARYIWKEKV